MKLKIHTPSELLNKAYLQQPAFLSKHRKTMVGSTGRADTMLLV